MTGVSVFPNPNKGILHITHLNEKKFSGDKSIKIYNIKNQLIYSKEIHKEKTVHLPEMKEGLYILHIETGEAYHTQRIYIEK